MCKLSQNSCPCGCAESAEQESCAAHEEVTVTFGGLKSAQNEAFQEGIGYGLRMAKRLNEQNAIFDLQSFNLLMDFIAGIYREEALYETPTCNCESLDWSDCMKPGHGEGCFKATCSKCGASKADCEDQN